MSTITFAGNLAADPETRFTPSGAQVANLVVLENRRRQNDAGEWEDLEPNRYRVQVWAALAENVAESVRRGDRVIVTGSVTTDRWSDKDTGDARTAQVIKASDIGFSMKYHTVQGTKSSKQGPQEGIEPDEG
jgi:single-strand DNA-binding protein